MAKTAYKLLFSPKHRNHHNMNIEYFCGGIFTNNKGGLLNLLSQLPASIREKLISYSGQEEMLKDKVELVVLFGNREAETKSAVEALGAVFESLGFGFGIITAATSDIDKVASINTIQYLELPKTLYTSFFESNRDICVPETWDAYKLSGKGVLVGFIDSGIDYSHPAFRTAEGNTRIDYIYDLSAGGKVWNSSDIDKALKSNNPSSIVPESDLSGHGTHVAGIACAGGNIDKRYYGVAYESSIAMVKMTSPGRLNSGKSTQLMRGIKFLLDKSAELKKPLVINLSFSTNDGAHDGNSLLEKYINTVSGLERMSFVVASGNEGDRAHHVGGVLKERQSIALSIAPEEQAIVLELYKSLVDDISIEIKNPAGRTSGSIDIAQGYKEGNLDRDRYFLYDTGPLPFNVNGEVIISLVAPEGFLLEGTWSITISLKSTKGNRYNIWLPIAEGLNPNTKFLQPNPFNTLGIPATVDNVISVGSYNNATGALSPFSGRGREGAQPTKPDLAAPGENIESSIPGGGYDALTGTSMACPHVAGLAALLIQWGIVEGKDPYMYGERLKYFLIKTAKRDRPALDYPNPLWGYGIPCVKVALDLATQMTGRGIYYEARQLIEVGTPIGCAELYLKEEYQSFIIEYDGDIINEFKGTGYGCAFVLDENYAVITVRNDKLNLASSETKGVVYVDEPAVYTLNAVSPLSSANILPFHSNPYLNLTGQGVILGMIDTGIDYLNPEFTKEDDTTRIISMWDQSQSTGKPPTAFNFGSEYSSADINKAIAASKAGGDPYSIVNSKDEIGHGTAMAGIMGGRGKNPELVGAAPDAEFIVVKLKPAKKILLDYIGIDQPAVPVYDSIDLILALKYIAAKARELNTPTSIHIPLGTNEGGHDGNSVLERYAEDLTKIRGLAIVTGTGNEGDTATHTSGTIQKAGDIKIIELKVGKEQKNLSLDIYGHRPDKISLGIVSPSGEAIDRIPAKLQQTEEIKLVFEGSRIIVAYKMPEEISGDEVISVKIVGIREGIWQFKLYGDYIVDGRYDAWIPQKALLKSGTEYLNPSQYTTLTSPAAARNIITCSYYNQNNNTLAPASGRGFTRLGRIKPEVACGGVSVLTTKPQGGTQVVSGSSAASAVLTGAVALILQWGIVLKRDPTLYSTKIISYIVRGTDQRPGDVYPNPEWGYGTLNMNKVFENIRSSRTEAQEISSESITLSIPEEILDYLQKLRELGY